MDSTTLEIDGPICAVPSTHTFTDVRVFLFSGGIGLGLSVFHFHFEINDEPTRILMTSSSTTVGRTGDSYSLKISIASRPLNIPYP